MDFRTLDLNQPQQLDITGGCNSEDNNNITINTNNNNNNNNNNNDDDIGLMTMVNDTITTDLFQNICPISKKDTFIIRAYKIITKESILNSNHIQQSLNISNKNNSSSKESYNKIGRNSRGLVIHPQYANTFDKISKIFNSLLSKGTMGDDIVSTKSSIELFQRFQQIIKEIQLNFDNSPYSKYFNKINDTLFQIKDSKELRNDLHWKTLSDEILSVYNPKTGRMINQGRKKNNTSHSNNNNNNNNNNSNSNTNGKNKKKISNDKSTSNSTTNNYNNTNWSTINNQQDISTNSTNSTLEDEFINMTTDLLNSTNNMGTDSNNDMLVLQRKLNNAISNTNNINISNNSDITTNETRPINIQGFYTQPTSPNILNGFTFPIESITTNNDTNLVESQQIHQQQQNQMINLNLDSTTQNSNHRKGRSLGSVDLDNLDSMEMNDILNYTNTNKRPKLNHIPKTNKQMSTLLDNTPNSIISTGTITNNSNLSQSNNIDNTNNTSVSDNIINKLNINNTLSTGRTNSKPMRTIDSNILQEVVDSYSKVLDEKDKRIQSLENEISLQRQETLWLRKMLIEDMGCVRNLLKDMTNK